MGGGGLRILGHKRWHVWRRDNVERVERDEQQRDAREQQLVVERRRVEQERRVEALVAQSGGERQAPEHVNLFRKEEEAASRVGTRNREARRDQQGGETLGSQVRVPWYAKERRGEAQEESRSREHKRKRDLTFADPLQHMRPAPSSDSEDEGRRRLSGSDRRRYSSRYSSSGKRDGEHEESGGDSRREKSKKSKHKKHKKHKSSREAMMEELRREREEREDKERRREEKLIRSRS